MEVKQQQIAVNFRQRMYNRCVTVEREDHRRRNNAKSIRRDKYACRPVSESFGQYKQHWTGEMPDFEAVAAPK